MLLMGVFTGNEISAADFTVDGYSYQVVSTIDYTCELCAPDDGSVYSEVVLPQNVSFRGKNLEVIGIGKNALGVPDSKDKPIRIKVHSGVKYIENQNTNWLIEVDVPELTCFLQSGINPCAPENNKKYFVNGNLPEQLVISTDYGDFRRVQNLESVKVIRAYSERVPLFTGSANLRDVVLENNLYIQSNCFADCTSLENISFCDDTEEIISDGVYTVGESAFKNCTSLKKINGWLNNEWLYKFTYVGCASLERLDISKNFKGLYEIYRYNGRPELEATYTPFEGNSKLATINLQHLDTWINLKSKIMYEGIMKNSRIGSCNKFNVGPYRLMVNNEPVNSITFTGAENIISGDQWKNITTLNKVEFKNPVDSIEVGVFENCTSLTEVTLCEGIKYVGSKAFYNCPIDHIVIPSSVEEFSGDAFYSAEKVDLHCDMQALRGTFESCNAKEINVHNSWISGVYKCPELKRFGYTGALGSVDEKAFWKCPNLEEFVWIGGDMHGPTFCEYSMRGTKIKSLSVYGWSQFVYGSFKDCKELEEVRFEGGATLYCLPPSKMTWNGRTHDPNAAFEGCDALHKISISQDLKIVYLYTHYGSYGSKTRWKTCDEQMSPWYCSDIDEVTVDGFDINLDPVFSKKSTLRKLTLKPDVRYIRISGTHAVKEHTSGSNLYLAHKFDYGISPNLIIESESTTPPEIIGGFPTEVYIDAIVRVPEGCVDAYRSAPVWEAFWNYETYSPSSGIDAPEIVVDDSDAPVEYYNLQGIKVANPAPGIYIRRQGRNVSKILIQ